MIIVEVVGKPVAWTAPRVTRYGTFSIHTKERDQVKWQMKAQFNRNPFETALKVNFDFYFVPPKSTSGIRRRQMLNGMMHKTTRPDLSNFVKFCEDCGTGILWIDDSIICESSCRKLFGETEKTVIRIQELSLL